MAYEGDRERQNRFLEIYSFRFCPSKRYLCQFEVLNKQNIDKITSDISLDAVFIFLSQNFAREIPNLFGKPNIRVIIHS